MKHTPFCHSARMIALALCSLIAIGCGPSLKRMDYMEGQYAPREGGCDVAFKRGVQVKDGKGVIIGTMRVRDTGFSTRCHEDEVLAILREEACSIGADVVVLRKIRPPDALSSCYRVSADFVRLNDASDIARLQSDKAYSDEEVQNRVQKGKALQVALGIIGGVAGFFLGYFLFSGM